MSKMNRAKNYIGKTIKVIDNNFLGPLKVLDVVYITADDTRHTALFAKTGLNFKCFYSNKERLEKELAQEQERLTRYESEGFSQEEIQRINSSGMGGTFYLNDQIIRTKKVILLIQNRLNHQDVDCNFIKLNNRLDRQFEIVQD